MRRTLFSILGLCVVLCSCIFTGCKPDSAEIVIAYTTDVRGNVLPYDFKNDKAETHSLANLFTLIKEQQSINKDNLVLLDCGNFFSGGFENYYSFQVDSLSEPISYRAIRMLPYDAIGAGDLDLLNPELLTPKKEKFNSDAKLICANLIDTRTGNPFFDPYLIIERGGIKIAVLAMVSPGLLLSLQETSWRYAETQDMVECALRWMPEIKKQNPDIIVGLFHTGEDYDKTLQEKKYKDLNGGIPVAKTVSGFDLVLLGGDGKHSIQELTNDFGQHFTVINAGKDCEYMGLARIHLNKQENGNYTKRITASCINTNQYEPDEDYSATMAPATSVLRQWINHPVGYLGDTLTGSEGIYGPTTYRSLVHNAQLWSTGANISLCSVQIASDTLLPGPISMRDIFRIYPTDNQIQILDMTGAEVQRYLEYGFANQFSTISSGKDDMLVYKRDKKGHIVYNEEGQPYLNTSPDNYTSATGIRYTVDISKPAGQRITILSMYNGSPFDVREHYRVAINNHLASSGSKFITQGIGWNQETLDMRTIDLPIQSLHSILREYFMQVDTVKLQLRGDWQIIPHNWWLEAKNRIKKEENPVWNFSND